VPGSETAVYLGNSWTPGTLIDVTTAKARSAPAPKGCGYDDPRRARDTGDVHKTDLHNVGAGPPDGFDWARGVAGNDADAIGVARPKGDVGLVLVGIGARTKATRWQRGVANLFGRPIDGLGVLAIGGGVAYLSLPDSIAAVNAATGDVRWTTKLVGAGSENVTLTSSRFYVVTLEWPALPVDVYDVSTGKLVARLGHGRED
jgi:hypothetical protein